MVLQQGDMEMEETKLSAEHTILAEDSAVQLLGNGQDVEVVVADKSNNYKGDLSDSDGPVRTHLYKKRFIILGIFCLYSMSSAFQWIEYAIIMNIVMKYYKNSSELAVAWTSMIYMLTFIPLMFVATWMLDKWGLRKSLLFGSALNAIGALIKIPSVGRDLFWLTFLGQTIAACAQSFILEIPPKIASLWFGPSEVSTATSVGVFGNQLGVALGFLLPPLIVPNSDDIGEIGAGFRYLFISSAAVCSILVFLIYFFITDRPPLPPSKACAAALVAEEENKAGHSSSLDNYKRSIGVLMKNVPFLLLLISYGINTGVYYAIGTLLNQIMYPVHPQAEKEIGLVGLTMVVAGLVGSVVCGFFLDKTKLYKTTTVGIYFFSMAFMVVFTVTLPLGHLWIDFISIGLLGFFMTGYLPIGFEFAAELTFPESEATSSGFLNLSAQVFGILFIHVAQELPKINELYATNAFMCVALLLGMAMTAAIKSELRRQAANEAEKKTLDDKNGTFALGETYSHNQNSNNNSSLYQENPEDDAKLIRLTSASSCYSAGPDW